MLHTYVFGAPKLSDGRVTFVFAAVFPDSSFILPPHVTLVKYFFRFF